MPKKMHDRPSSVFSGEDNWLQWWRSENDRHVPFAEHSRDTATAVASLETPSSLTAVPTDPLFTFQWHLQNTGQTGGTAGVDINAVPVWDDYTGDGVVIGVVDTGIEYTHPDLVGGYDQTLDYDALDRDNDAFAGAGENHATAVSGVIVASADNNLGLVGVAYDAEVAGFRMGFGANTEPQIEENLWRQASVDISNNSWTYGGFFYDDFKSTTFLGSAAAIENAVTEGRDGLGTVFVFAAGNGRQEGQDVNYHGFQNSPYTISVAALDHNGVYADFSNPGAALLISAPGVDIATTDRVGSNGYVSSDYVSISGTSFSSPIVAGTIALMLEANSGLGYRDVQEILVYSARLTDASSLGWEINGASNWNGGGLHFSHDYGFGLIDAHAAVRLAETWTDLGTKANLVTNSVSSSPDVAIPDLGSVSDTITIAPAQGLQIDHVGVRIEIDHTWIGDLTVTLTSPDGTESVLVNRPGKTAFSAFGSSQDDIRFDLDSTQFWGETGIGDWTLTVSDGAGGDIGVLESWTLTLYGDPITLDDLYIFTDEFAVFAPPGFVLSDAEGNDTLNAAAITSSTSLDLSPGATNTLAGKSFSIDAGTVIESAYLGDGNDELIGNAADNLLEGGRGDDRLMGGAGDDMLGGGAGTDVALYSGYVTGYSIVNVDAVTAMVTDLDAGDGDEGSDTLKNFEGIQFADFYYPLDGTVSLVAPPVITAIADDTGAPGDRVTADNRLVVSGTAAANATVELFLDGVSMGTTTADAGGAWSFQTGTVADGAHDLTATAADPVGNTSPLSSAFGIVVDTVAPVAPAVTGIADDRGVSGSDGITNDNDLLVSGTAEADAKVELFLSGQSLGTTVADDGGAWSFQTGVIADGAYDLTAEAADLAGNVSPLSNPLDITVDRAAPAPPVVTGIANDTGISGSDRITSDNDLLVTGTAEANATVELFLGGESLGTTGAEAGGAWSFQTGPIADGAHDLTATATDAAGNPSGPSAALGIVVDTTAPAPVITAIGDDTGMPGDGVTSDNTLMVFGTAEAEATVELFLNDQSLGTAAADAGGAWSVQTGVIADGAYDLTAVATDLAGNVSARSQPFGITVDTATPAAPVVTGIADDSGTSGSDRITSDNDLLVTGTAEADATVEVFLGSESLGTTVADDGGAWSLQTGSIIDGAHDLTATATDTAGNLSAPSAAFGIVVDTVTPAPGIAAIADDTGTPGDGVTSDNTLMVTGTAEAEATVELFLNDQSLGTAVADAGGAWSIQTGVIADGIYDLTAVATDRAGNVSSASAPFGITVDTATPAPALTGIADDTAISGSDGITNDNDLLVTGTAEAGATVELFLNGGSRGTAVAGADGSWSFQTGVIADGAHELTAVATDLAGNVSALSEPFGITVDTATPAEPIISAISDDTRTAGDGVTSDNTLVISGTAEADVTVELFLSGLSLGTTATDSGGAWSFQTGAIADGGYDLTATATDLAGNTSGASPPFGIVVDTAAPAAPVVTGIADDTGVSSSDQITNDNDLLVTGAAEAGATLVLFLDGGSLGTTVADASGAWSFQTGVIADGTHDLTAAATDLAGNVSSASVPFGIVVDRVAPAAPVVVGIADDTGASGSDGTTSDNDLLVTGTAEAGATVELFLGGQSLGSTVADAGGAWSFQTGVIADGAYELTAVATDLAGNISGLSEPFAITVDTVTPAAPMVTAIADDTGIAGDGVTSDNTLMISGTAEANATVELFLADQSLSTTVADAGGAWSFQTGPIADGAHDLSATATDAAGNLSDPSAAFGIVVDTTAPTPAITAIGDDTGMPGDGVTSDNRLVVSGTAEAEATVELFLDGGSLGTTVAGADGSWSVQTGVIADGAYVLTTVATDLAGNVSTLSDPFGIAVDTATPAAPVVSGIADDTGLSGSDGITSDNDLLVSGTAEANATVELFLGAQSLGTTVADAGGAWSFQTGPIADGAYDLTATATDTAGNLSDPSAPFAIVIESNTASYADSEAGLVANLGDEAFIFSTIGNGSVPGLGSFANEDLILWDGSSFSMFFDGSTYDLTSRGENIDAAFIRANGNIVFSTNGRGSLPGVGSFVDEDLIEWDGEFFTKLFEGSNNDLGDIGEDIDAVHILANGSIFLSISSSATLAQSGGGTLNIVDGDVVEYNPSNTIVDGLAPMTARLLFDEGTFTSNEDIAGLAALANQSLVLSTKGSATLPGSGTFADEDLVAWDGTASTKIFDGSTYGLGSSEEDIDALHVLANTGDAAGQSYDGITNLIGSPYDDILVGDDAGNALSGGEGDDILIGAAGDDALSGDAGDDWLMGGDGSDSLAGGTGADDLAGGLGGDSFVFADEDVGQGVDMISDFDRAEGDGLDLSDLFDDGGPIPDGSTIDQFLNVTDDGVTATLQVDSSGGTDGFTDLASLAGVPFTNADLPSLLEDGTILVA